MSVENKAMVKSFIQEVINGGDLAAMDKYFAADYKENSAMPGMAPGIEGFRQAIGMFMNAFPDMKFETQSVVAEGDRVVLRGKTTGTHKGDFMGVAPTGKTFEMMEIHEVRIANGKVVEHWGLEDNMTMMQQLGISPEQMGG